MNEAAKLRFRVEALREAIQEAMIIARHHPGQLQQWLQGCLEIDDEREVNSALTSHERGTQ
jgi:hypothetical protein